jgi:mRNA interferase MazF
MARLTYVPDRGDLVHLRFSPSAGREQTGPRYALVLSPRSYNRAAGLAIVCPITTQVKGYPFEAEVRGDRVRGVVLSDHIRSADWRERDAQFVERADGRVLDEVLALVNTLIGPHETE